MAEQGYPLRDAVCGAELHELCGDTRCECACHVKVQAA